MLPSARARPAPAAVAAQPRRTDSSPSTGAGPARPQPRAHHHHGRTTTLTLTLTQAHATAAARIDAIDLEPIVYKLTHPDPGETELTLPQADQAVAAYRCFLKLCAWYPQERIVPSRAIDAVWHAHILDTAKYAGDSQHAFGYFLHHFPYLGLRGPADIKVWNTAYESTRDLFGRHFGISLPAGQAGRTCHNGGSSCNSGGTLCSNEKCEKSIPGDAQNRPCPDRTAIPA